MEREHGAEVELGEHVAVAHHEALVDAVGGEANTARGTEWLLLDRIAQPHVAEPVVREVLADRVGEIAHREDDLVDAVCRQPRELPLEERHVRDRQQRLRHAVGERPKARALAPDEDDRLHGLVVVGVVLVAEVVGGAVVVAVPGFTVVVAVDPGFTVVVTPGVVVVGAEL